MNTILTTILSTITGLIIGYLTKLLKGYKDRDNVQNMALRNILKSNLKMRLRKLLNSILRNKK